SEEHTSELQSLTNLVCRLLLEKKKNARTNPQTGTPCTATAHGYPSVCTTPDALQQTQCRLQARSSTSPATNSRLRTPPPSALRSRTTSSRRRLPPSRAWRRSIRSRRPPPPTPTARTPPNLPLPHPRDATRSVPPRPLPSFFQSPAPHQRPPLSPHQVLSQ